MKISEAKAWFKNRRTKIQETYTDDVGAYGFRVDPDEFPDDAFDVSAVGQAHSDGTVSAMRQLIERADDHDRYLILFVGSPPPLVFDPADFLEKGEEYIIQDARQRRGETWFKIPKDWGVTLEAVADGRAEPGVYNGDLRDFMDP
jgi:hypothetical protein